MFSISLIFVKFHPLFAAACSSVKDVGGGNFFFLPPWWEYAKKVTVDGLGQCVPNFSFPGDGWAIVLFAVDVLLRLAGFLAVISIIIAGISYMTSLGNPEKITSARKRIVNSIIGLTIALIATAIVSFLGKHLGG